MSEEAMRSVNSLNMNISLTTLSGFLPVTLVGTGIAERPNKIYTKLWLLFQSMELLTLDTEKTYLRRIGESTWEIVSPEEMDLPTALFSNAFSLVEVRETAINPKIIGAESINNLMCHHLTMGIDLPSYLKKRAPTAASQIDLFTSKASVDIWISEGDSRIYKLYLDMQLYVQGEEYPVQVTIELSHFNERINFPPPPNIP